MRAGGREGQQRRQLRAGAAPGASASQRGRQQQLLLLRQRPLQHPRQRQRQHGRQRQRPQQWLHPLLLVGAVVGAAAAALSACACGRQLQWQPGSSPGTARRARW